MRESRMRFSGFLALVLITAFATGVVAQTTTATIRGKVVDQNGAPVADAEINAVSTESGFVKTATARDDGTFLLPGLVPGNYNIVVASPAFEPRSQDLTVLVGQTLDMTLQLSPSSVLSEEITVIGNVPVEMKATEVAMQITREQIENLPQNDRNFMNFAALAPGVTLSTNPERKTFQAGAQGADQVNVFVDGVSFKNDVIQGGVVGQDSSKGNPFPQNAVQEFRVLTQNYSAEFQKASSAVITAVTKSGTNSVSGEVFAFFQDDGLVDENPLSGVAETFFERLQTGLSVGGPIIRDRMHYFLGYEGNDQDRESEVIMGGAGPAALRAQLAQYEGVFPSTFKLGLYFGKLSFQPGPAHLLDVSAFMRNETDVRGFGGDNSFQQAEDIQNDVWQLGVRHQYAAASWLNEASISMQDYSWNPQPVNPDLVGQFYIGILRVGGRSTEQNIQQQRLSLRDDLTFAPFDWRGSHVVKIGANVDQADYTFLKDFNGNPQYEYRSDEAWAFPYQAFWGVGDPEITADNTQFGIYAQDEWSLTDKLLLNLGFRWDYESNMFPQDWVTPADVRAKFASWVDADRYFTDGNDREPITDMFAPRLGFSYDLFSNNRTVFFGGIGRYYDRLLFNNTLDERFRLQFMTGRFNFSANGAPRPNGEPTVAWRPEYLTEAGLAQLRATGITGNPEVFLIENNTKAQFSDQWTLGARHNFGPVVGSLSYGSTKSQNGFTFTWGHLNTDGTCCRWGEIGPLGYAAILVSNDDVRTWYDAVYLTLDKPFTGSARWGGNLSYTFSEKAEAIGGDLFSLDFPTLSQYPRRPLLGIQDHRLVANAIVRLPWNFNAGAILNYGSGYRYDIFDRSGTGGIPERITRAGGTGDPYTTIDLRLEYGVPIGPVQIGLIGEAFNITNEGVFTNYNGDIFTLPAVNPNFGKPREIVFGTQRRFQFGARVKF